MTLLVIRQHALACFFPLAVCLTIPYTAYALSLGQFSPVLTGYEGELDIDALSNSNKSKSGANSTTIQDTLFRETLALSTTGYVYHPRFMTFLVSVGGGLQQEHYLANDTTDSSFQNTTVETYELRTIFLAEHPYNVELFTLRQEPFISGVFLSGLTVVDTQSGANLNFNKRPWSVSLSYLHDSTQEFESSTATTTATDTYTATASYEKGFLANYLNCMHTDSSISTNASNTSSSLYYFNMAHTGPFKLQSNAGITLVSQQSSQTLPLDTSTTVWNEQLSAKLPLNFDAALSYSYYMYTNITDKGSSEETKDFTKNLNPSGEITHHLFESLTSSYQYSYLQSESNSGNVETRTSSLSFNYIKRILWGTLSAGVTKLDTKTATTGTPLALNENHSAQTSPFPNNSFVLGQQFINEASIVIMVEDANNQLVTLPAGDYQVVPYTNSFQIFIIQLPQQVTNLRPADYTYAFQVQYSLQGNNTTETQSMGYHLRLQLFNRMVNPYISYQTLHQTLVSGSIIGGPQSSIDRIYGVVLSRAPWSLQAEYQSLDAEDYPTRSSRAEADYQKDITKTINLSAKVFYTNEKHLQSPLVAPYTDRDIGTSATMMKSFPARNLYASITGSYTVTSGLSAGASYSLGGTLTWRVGKMDISAGATITRAEATPTQVSAADRQEVDTDYFFIKLKRKIL